MTLTEESKTLIERITASSQLNILPQSYGGGRCFSKPFFGISRGDDPLFEKFKEVIAVDHPTPAEIWTSNGLPDKDDLATELRILSMVFPYSHEVRKAGEKNNGRLPAELTTIARNYSEEFINMILPKTVEFFIQKGFFALAPKLTPDYGYIRKDNPFAVYSNWSERHVAFVAGLGYFGFNNTLITKEGCSVILASVITDAPLSVTVRTIDNPHNCLHYTSSKCEKCVTKCPSDALTKDGHQPEICLNYCTEVRSIIKELPIVKVLKKRYRKLNFESENHVVVSYPSGCTLCQFGVPCTDKDPLDII